MKTCKKHGPYEAECLEAFGRVIWKPCPLCAEEREKFERETKRQDRFLALLEKSGIPKRFRRMRLEAYKAHNDGQKLALTIAKKYIQDFQERREKGCSLVFCGMPGTGKTHLACAIAKKLMGEYGVSTRYVQALKAMQRVKATYGKNVDETEANVIGDYVSHGLLIFDEVGLQFGSETEKMIIYQIINGRYENIKPTIMISNLSETELAAYVGERTIDRMREGGGAVVAFDWDSWRKKAT